MIHLQDPHGSTGKEREEKQAIPQPCIIYFYIFYIL